MNKGSAIIVDRYCTLTRIYDHRMAPGSDGHGDVYHLNKHGKGREEGQKGLKRTKTADIELELTPKRVPKKDELLSDCYQSHGIYVREARAQWGNNSGTVWILRSSSSDRVLKCYMSERTCVELPPTHRADPYGLTTIC